MLTFNISPEKVKDIVAKLDIFNLFNVNDEDELTKLMAFSKAVWESLNQVHGDSMMLMMSHIQQLAIDEGGFKPYDMFADPTGNIDTKKLVASSNKELLYERLAHALAAEWKKYPVAV